MKTIIPACGAVIAASLAVLLAKTGRVNVVLAAKLVTAIREER